MYNLILLLSYHILKKSTKPNLKMFQIKIQPFSYPIYPFMTATGTSLNAFLLIPMEWHMSITVLTSL